MNLTIRDETDDDKEGEGQVDQQQEEEVMNLEEEIFFKAISKIRKRPKFDVPIFFRKY